MALDTFHPAVSTWFREAFTKATPAQAQAWPAIAAGRHTLIAAPTGSGKTLAAFLAALDDLVRRGLDGTLPDETCVVYVSPLKALSNDVRANLEKPLAGIGEVLVRLGLAEVPIRTMVRTGDTPQAERAAMRKRPPHIVVTTPESLYILLGSESGRRMLGTARTVIIDEIHALAPNKRGAHLALSLQRLDALCGRRLQRIGLSATQKPVDEVARFLTGAQATEAGAGCAIVDIGHARARDLAIELPDAPLEAVMSGDARSQMHARLEALIERHRTTLVFVNTRRMAERVARHLSEQLGKDRVTAHHGSMAREHRLDAEQRLKRGELSALVATASLELGIDIGDVDLVCQIGSPRSIATFLQRAGRAGHQVGGLPKARLFPESRDDLVECAALLDAVRRGELDQLVVERAPLDVLAQQIVAEVACRDWNEQDLYDCLRGAHPFAMLDRAGFTRVVRMLAEGFSTRRGPRSAWLHRDVVNGVLRAARGARLTALTSGGAIPDTADYEVVLEPEGFRVGTVNEDFAVESIAGDVFQLGNQSYRILRVERGKVRVEDARGAPPSIPFWLGEAPGRSDELSRAVARLRAEVADRLPSSADDVAAAARAWLCDEVGLGEAPARQLADYLASARAALGVMPTQEVLVLERFFDEAGGMQLVIHSPHGSRLNRAWGLALRKRFCRSFNFELQAAATEDAIVLSLSTSHSFPLEEVARYLHSASAEGVLVQALLDAPMFGVRWRWNAVTALALPRWQGGAPVPPQLQRMKAEDLLASVFPDQVACLENIVGERQIPDHPLVAQTLHDCLRVAMDVDGFIALLRRMEAGTVRVVARDLAMPSPLAAEVLGARPYAYLDDAPLEERRTQAVASRGLVDPARADDLGRLDPEAIAAVRGEAWPEARTPDELHAALLGIGFLADDEVAMASGWRAWLESLGTARRATRLVLPAAHGMLPVGIWVPAERLAQIAVLAPAAEAEPVIAAPPEHAAVEWTPETALVDLVRARLTALGPVTASRLAASLAKPPAEVEAALLVLEREGGILRGRFSAAALQPGGEMEWCERHLLARIHRYTVQRLRREIEPVEPRDFMRFLFDWQHVAPGTQLRGPDALGAVLAAIEGYEAPAAAWEASILPARIADYDIGWLDQLCQSGRVAWLRLRAATGASGAGPVRATPIVLVPRRHLQRWIGLSGCVGGTGDLPSRAQAVAEHLATCGASFFDELRSGTRLLETELQEALGQLVAAGRVHADGFSGLRALIAPARAGARRRTGGRRLLGLEDAGRWALLPCTPASEAGQRREAAGADALEHVVRALLRRYGVVCWRLLANEAPWLPPWRELLRVCHRLEARGEIRGGRFIAGISGEQFALPEAVVALRQVRRRERDGQLVCIGGADPLNLVGTLLAGERLPHVVGARVLYRDGMPVATRRAGKTVVLVEASAGERHAMHLHLLRGRAPAAEDLGVPA